MALFGGKKEEKKEMQTPAEKEARTVVSPKLGKGEGLSHVLTNPRITEKATDASVQGTYVFNVARDANKKQIARAVQMLYKVEPKKVRIVTLPTKTIRNARTGMVGTKGGGKKAYVYLKEGDSISIM